MTGERVTIRAEVRATEQEARAKAVEAIRQYGKIESLSSWWPSTLPPSEA